MTLLAYQVFKNVAEQKSFKKAAELMGLTPSAVSHTIASFEDELGFTLLNRGKGSITLTNYGENLLPFIYNVLNSDESLHQAVSDFNGLKKGQVKIGCFSSVCTNWIPDILKEFGDIYPEIETEVFQGTYDDVHYWIKNGIVDFGFLSVSSAGGLPIEPLYKDPLLCVMKQGWLGKNKKNISTEELKKYTFVTQRESTDADIQKFMKDNALDVRSKYHVVDDLSTVAMVANGFGICIMPELTMRDIPYRVDTCRLNPDAYRVIGIAALRAETLAPAARAMYKYIISNHKTNYLYD